MEYTVEQLKVMLKEAEEKGREQKRENEKKQTEAWSAIRKNPNNWEWKATYKPNTYDAFDKTTRDLVYIAKRIKPEIVEAWSKNGISTFSDDFQKIGQFHGMNYYRTDENILDSTGGGHCLLKVPKLCSDEEWQQILIGKIPDKFISASWQE